MDTNHLQEQAHMTEIDLADCRQGFVFREQTPQGGNIPVRRHKQVIKTALQEGYAKGIISQCAGGVYKAEHPTVCADVITPRLCMCVRSQDETNQAQNNVCYYDWAWDSEPSLVFGMRPSPQFSIGNWGLLWAYPPPEPP